MNLFGADVQGIDVAGFLATARHVFPLLALAWLALLWSLRRGWWLLLGIVLANAYLWFETTWPLQRLYALGPSSDRLNNVALCQIAAAGHPILLSHQVGTFQIEPLWSVVVAAASGWNTGRLLRVYAVLPLVAVTAFAVSMYFALGGSRPGGEDWSEWKRALVVGAASLLCSGPLDHLGPYRVPWVMTFLLKPNHAAALVVLPWLVRRVANMRGGRDRLAAGALLGLVGWLSPIPMALAGAGLILFAVAGRPLAREGRELRDAIAIVATGLLVVGPYALLLLFTHRSFPSGVVQTPLPWLHLVEVPVRAGWLFPLAVWGTRTALRGDRLGRLWAFQLIGALIVWLALYPASFIPVEQLGPVFHWTGILLVERDDMFYWTRILLALVAAVGAWDLATRAAGAARVVMVEPAVRAGLLAALAVPVAMPSWWDPARMDSYFPGSIPPIDEGVMDAAAALARAPGEGILVGDPALARWMAALTGRRVAFAAHFPPPPGLEKILWLTQALLRADQRAAIEANRLGFSHVIVGRLILDGYGLTPEGLAHHPYLRQVSLTRGADGDIVALYEILHPHI